MFVFLCIFIQIEDVNRVLGDIITRMSCNRNFESHYAELQSICIKIIDSTRNLEELLLLVGSQRIPHFGSFSNYINNFFIPQDNFLPLLDLMQKDSIRMEICKHVMVVFKNRSTANVTCSDAVLTNALMYICKILNDTTKWVTPTDNEISFVNHHKIIISVFSAFSGEDERRQISDLISHFIKTIDYGKDFEKQLSFYVEARTSFPNFDSVFVTLVHSVNSLAIHTHRIVNGQHTRRTAAFVRGCVAYCFITIPSITSISTQMDLYLLSGQIALTNHCLGQADACFGAAIKLIDELAKSGDFDNKKLAETYLTQFTSNLLSTLIMVPVIVWSSSQHNIAHCSMLIDFPI